MVKIVVESWLEWDQNGNANCKIENIENRNLSNLDGDWKMVFGGVKRGDEKQPVRLQINVYGQIESLENVREHSGS